MSEIWISETLVCLFLALPLFRPLIKTLWPLDGLVWLPLIALIILAGIFPAYGFRPECLPIMLFALIYNAANLGPFFSSLRSQSSDAFRDRNPLITVFAFIMLGGAAFTMYAFSPRTSDYPQTETGSARLLKIPGKISGGEYCLQIYGPIQAVRPLIFLVPPEIGSSASVELVCTELANKGYTVVTYSRKDFDFPFIDENGKKHFSLPLKMPGYFYSYASGTKFASANKRGRALEAERQIDIEYLLPRVYELFVETSQAELPPVLLVGYGAGGSALAYLNTDGEFASKINVLGIVAIESPLWSSYETKAPRFLKDSPAMRGFSYRGLLDIVDRLADLLPKNLIRADSLPSASLPVLYLVSGRDLKSPLLSGSGPIATAAIEDAAPLDYQDFPLTHPVYSFSFEKLKNAANYISDTASIIGNFGSLLLEQSAQAEPAAQAKPAAQAEPALSAEQESDGLPQPVMIIPPASPINGSLYVESKEITWLNFP